MKTLFITALTLLLSIAYAQQQTSSFKRLYMGISTTQGVSYRKLTQNGNTYMTEPGFMHDIYERNKAEIPGYCANAGVRFGINTTKFMSIEMGIECSKKGYFAKQNSYEYHGFMAQYGENYIQPDNGYKIRMVYHYIDIPLALNFLIGKKKIKALISTGVSMNIQLDKRVKTTYSIDGERHKKNDYGARYQTIYNFSPFLGLGINYQLNSCLNLNIMPIVHFQTMNNINKDFYHKEYLYSGGINMALNFGFIDVNTKPKN